MSGITASAEVASRPATTGIPPAATRAVLLAAIAASVLAAVLATDHAAASRAALADPDLTRLLRAMAGLKAVVALAAAAAMWWRLAVPVGVVRLGAYAVAAMAMAAGPGLIWQMQHVAAGALLLHGGLFAAALLLWRDPAMSAQLAAAVARRRKRRAG